MCGIAGLFATPDAPSRIRVMSDCIAHRGRDDDALDPVTAMDGSLAGALAHRRLSVLDLSPAGRQPMATADGRLVIVFNGEIYNYEGLRTELQGAGASFRGHSDTEVILEGWRRQGVAFLARLRGMFALAIWDRERSELVLARDQFGIKPLYIAKRGHSIGFASEIRALVAAGFGTRALSPAAVGAYLALGSIPEPLTIVQGIEPLPPGTVRIVSLRGGNVIAERNERFAVALSPAGRVLTRMEEAAPMLRDALRESVAYHLVSDVPVGLFLSGGVDSSAVVALAAEAADKPLDTFTVVFDEARFSEAGPARAVAERYGTRHTEIHLRGSDFLAALPAAFAAMDQPSLDGLNTYVVSQGVHAAGLKVVLSGLGGDELFGGYRSFSRAWNARRWWGATRPLHGLAHRLAGRLGDLRAGKIAEMFAVPDLALGAYRASRALFAGRALEELTGVRAELPYEQAPDGLTLLQRVSWYETTGYMRSVLLRDSDVFSMAHHLELRVPFVDRGVAAASLRIADALKVQGGGKAVLVEAVRDLLPQEVWNRPKQGFTLPFADWLRGRLAGEVGSALASTDRVERVGLRPRAVRAVWEAFRAGRAGVSWSRPWALYTLIRWAETVDASVASGGSAAEGRPSLRASA